MKQFFFAAAALALIGAAAPPRLDFPSDYRGWMHVKSAVVGKASPAFAHFGGLHHIYANPKAADGFRSGMFADGAALAFDVFDVSESAAGVEPTKRRQIDVMVRDSVRFGASGGWGFAEFAPGTPPVVTIDAAKGAAGCAGCHATAPGGVFSRPM